MLKRLIIFLGLMFLATGAIAKQAKDIYKDTKQSIFTVYSTTSDTKRILSFGSAVAVTPNILATNCHIFITGDRQLVEINEKRTPAKLVYQDSRQDLCLLKIPKANFKPVKMYNANEIEIGEEVYAIGNPIGLDKSLSRGIISNKHIWRGGTLLQTDASISKGSSGGGLFDNQGRLIGITTMMAADGNDISMAIPPSAVRKGLAEVRKFPNRVVKVSNEEKLLGLFGKERIALVQHQSQCFIFIFNKPLNQNPELSLIWWPNNPNYMFVLTEDKKPNKNFLLINGAPAKDYLVFEKHRYPVANYRDFNGMPMRYTTIPFSPKESLMNEKDITYHQFNKTHHMTTFTLKGFQQAIKMYDQECGMPGGF